MYIYELQINILVQSIANNLHYWFLLLISKIYEATPHSVPQFHFLQSLILSMKHIITYLFPSKIFLSSLNFGASNQDVILKNNRLYETLSCLFWFQIVPPRMSCLLAKCFLLSWRLGDVQIVNRRQEICSILYWLMIQLQHLQSRVNLQSWPFDKNRRSDELHKRAGKQRISNWLIVFQTRSCHSTSSF